MQTHEKESAIFRIERPSPKLMQYYLLKCLATGPLFPIILLPHYFKYYTLRYRFDEEGISMRWGILFRREVILNYTRIQDIHLCSNVIERWLGLAKVQIQTASGSASAEMTIEGLIEFEALRDFLYTKMRGMKDPSHGRASARTPERAADDSQAELAQLLQTVAEELRGIRLALERKDNSDA